MHNQQAPIDTHFTKRDETDKVHGTSGPATARSTKEHAGKPFQALTKRSPSFLGQEDEGEGFGPVWIALDTINIH